MNGQTRKHSLLESFVNIPIGYGIAIAAQLVIFPRFEFHPPLRDNLMIGALFTVVSLIRSYALRRAFNWWMLREQAACPPSLRAAVGTLKVQKRACATCIYGKNWHGTPISALEAQVADGYGFVDSRICHHSDDVTCRGFWNQHKDKFAAGQTAQRLGCVEFVQVDTRPEMGSA